MTQFSFRDVLAQPTIDLVRANVHIARALAHPQLDPADVDAQLSACATAARRRVEASAPLRTRAVQLSRFLFDELGFQGNGDHYDDPRNSFLNEVLQRRVGIPLSLSIIYLVVAARLDIPVDGVGMPGHFLVSVPLDGAPLYLDPFHQGRELNRAECEALMRRQTGYRGFFDPSWLEPVSAREMVARQLRNLRTIYLQAVDWSRASIAIEHLRLAEPEEARHLRDLGLVYYQSGRRVRGCYYLEQYLAANPDAEDAPDLRRGLKERLDQWAVAN
jgi:regulator of sirC expression with transglutaminase-like and TPR domain